MSSPKQLMNHVIFTSTLLGVMAFAGNDFARFLTNRQTKTGRVMETCKNALFPREKKIITFYLYRVSEGVYNILAYVRNEKSPIISDEQIFEGFKDKYPSIITAYIVKLCKFEIPRMFENLQINITSECLTGSAFSSIKFDESPQYNMLLVSELIDSQQDVSNSFNISLSGKEIERYDKTFITRHHVREEDIDFLVGQLSEEHIDTPCVVCMAAPQTHGFSHTGCVHKALCKDCIQELSRCPICNQTGDKVQVIAC